MSASDIEDKILWSGYLWISRIVAWVGAVVAFFGSWIYCVSTYGYLLGFGVGWLPSIILAVTVWFLAWLWPLALFASLIFYKTAR